LFNDRVTIVHQSFNNRSTIV